MPNVVLWAKVRLLKCHGRQESLFSHKCDVALQGRSLFLWDSAKALSGLSETFSLAAADPRLDAPELCKTNAMYYLLV
jgi:hypothetical protein